MTKRMERRRRKGQNRQLEIGKRTFGKVKTDYFVKLNAYTDTVK